MREIKEGQMELGERLRQMDLLVRRAMSENQLKKGGIAGRNTTVSSGGSSPKEAKDKELFELRRRLQQAEKEKEKLQGLLGSERAVCVERQIRVGEFEAREDEYERYKARLLVLMEEAATKAQGIEMDLRGSKEALHKEKDSCSQLQESKSQLQVQTQEVFLRIGVLEKHLYRVQRPGGIAESSAEELSREQQARVAVLEAERQATEAHSQAEQLKEAMKDLELQVTEAMEKAILAEGELGLRRKRQRELEELLAKSEAGKKEMQAGIQAAAESGLKREEEAKRRNAELQEAGLRRKEEATRLAKTQLEEEKEALRNLEKDLDALRESNQKAEERCLQAEQARRALELKRDEAQARNAKEEKEYIEKNPLRRRVDEQKKRIWSMDRELQLSRREKVIIYPWEAAKVLSKEEANKEHAELCEENASLHLQLLLTRKITGSTVGGA